MTHRLGGHDRIRPRGQRIRIVSPESPAPLSSGGLPHPVPPDTNDPPPEVNSGAASKRGATGPRAPGHETAQRPRAAAGYGTRGAATRRYTADGGDKSQIEECRHDLGTWAILLQVLALSPSDTGGGRPAPVALCELVSAPAKYHGRIVRTSGLMPLGGFASADPFEGLGDSPPSPHKYPYAGDGPVDASDPTGRFISLAGAFTAMSMLNTLRAMAVAGSPVCRGSGTCGPDVTSLVRDVVARIRTSCDTRYSTWDKVREYSRCARGRCCVAGRSYWSSRFEWHWHPFVPCSNEPQLY
jgi:hypothetical protein